MSTKHKVIVSGDSISLSRKQGFSNRIVNLEQTAQIASFVEDSQGEALIALNDGSVRKIIKCNGVNPFMYSSAELDAAAKWFTELAEKCDFAFQILCITSATQSKDYMEENVAPLMKTELEYANWWGEYHRSWFLQVNEIIFVPKRFFYVVIPCEKQKGSAKAAEAKQTRELTERVQFMMSFLKSFELKPAVLNRADARVLLQSRTNPATRELETIEEIPEYETPSTLCLPRAYEKSFELQIAGSHTSTQFLTMLPTEVFYGWFWKWLEIYGFNALSIHLRPGKPLPDKKKRTAMTVAFSTWSDNSETLIHSRESLRHAWSETGAIIDNAETWQLEGWLATLPLAINTVPLTHTVAPEIVGDTNPFIDDRCGHGAGTIFGFSAVSRQPVLLNPFHTQEGEQKIALICGNEKDKETLFKLLVSRMLPMGARMIMADEAGSMRSICSTLGPDEAKSIEVGNAQSLDLSEFGNFGLQVYDLKECPIGNRKGTIEAIIAKTIEHARATPTQPLILFIKEISELFETHSGKKALQELARCNIPNLSIYLGTKRIAAVNKQPSLITLFREIKTKLLMRETSEEALEVLEKLGVNDPEIAAIALNKPQRHLVVSLEASGRKGMVNAILSPLEYWLFAESVESMTRLRMKMNETTEKNPEINITDRHRMAVYYLSLEA
ncbi:MAG: hypothetical protein K2X77_31605 [Candidatus Obscuribacterales bacterium]|nr:hypothetical protein [Candidatus Obscuribacterales bacterium]